MNTGIRVVGVGGLGVLVVERMLAHKVPAGFIAIGTDRQALTLSSCPRKLELCTRGRAESTSAHMEAIRRAAEEKRDAIADALHGTRIAFLIAGLGGATGTSVMPVVARLASAMDILTIGVVTMPFVFEGKKKTEVAEEGGEDLLKEVQGLLVMQNLPMDNRQHTVTNRFEPEETPVYETLQSRFEAVESALGQHVRNLVERARLVNTVSLDFVEAYLEEIHRANASAVHKDVLRCTLFRPSACRTIRDVSL